MFGLAVAAVSVWFVVRYQGGIDGGAVRQGLASVSWSRVAICLIAVATAFAAVAGQERAIIAHMGLVMPRGRGGRAAVAAAAVSQTVGFGPVVGAIVRRRLVPELTLGQSFAISAGLTLGFFAGLGVLTLASFALVPGMPHRWAAQVALVAVTAVAAAMVLSPGPALFGLRKPNLFVLARFMGWLVLDLAALATALWVVLPVDTAPAFLRLLPVFLIALGIGIASGSPGGVGPFEATLLAYLPHIEEAGLLAGIIAFRALAYAVPALCGALWAVAGQGRAARPTDSGLTQMRHLPTTDLRALPWAEVQLIRQGGLWLLSGAGWLWLSGKLAHTRVVLGPVMGPVPPSEALAQVEHLAKSEARMLCLYKIDARLAAAARARGYAVLPIAREAVLNPQIFTPAGPEKARLRRKLAHARKAGVSVCATTTLPLIEMAEVAQDWQQVHGRERGFSMGRWDPDYVAGQHVIVARSSAGVLLAFITFHQGQDDWVLDLVRFRPGVPDGTTYAMVCCALAAAKDAGIGRLSLAAVPDAAFGLTGLLARIVQRATQGSIGLAQFKSAFAPAWEARYVAAPGRLTMVLAGLEVARAILRPGKLPPPRHGLTVHHGDNGADDAPAAADRAA